MEQLLKSLDSVKTGEVIDVKTTPKRTPAPHLFDLTELQKEAHKRYGWSAKETLSTLQNLYERHKIVTYPRTDSKHLTSDMKSTFTDRIKASAVGDYRAAANKILSKGTPQAQKVLSMMRLYRITMRLSQQKKS